jgi:FkbM family methyltransferase
MKTFKNSSIFIKMNLSKFVKRAFKLIDLKIVRLKNSYLDYLKIGLVIDVGAYQGQFGNQIRRDGYNGYIYSFEPQISAHKILKIRASNDPKWDVHDAVAVGSTQQETTLNISANPTSSSIKEMLFEHLRAAPYSQTIGKENIKVISLDSMISAWKSIKSPICLKIDTQGYEFEVLEGGKKTLELVTAVQIELSTLELYRGQKLYDYFIEFFKARDFILFDIIPGFSNRQTGQLLQFDAIFVKQSYLN